MDKITVNIREPQRMTAQFGGVKVIERSGKDGFSPIVNVEEIDGGHRVTITDAAGEHVFDVMDGNSGIPPAGSVYVTDSHGHSWYVPTGDSDDTPVIFDENGDAWHMLPGIGGEDDISVTDEAGNQWHFKKAETDEGTSDYDELVNKPTLNGVEISGDKTSEDYGIECLIPAGGNVGDLVWKTSEGTGWVTPANDLTGDNTRPITASAVNTIVGNIDALLATI